MSRADRSWRSGWGRNLCVITLILRFGLAAFASGPPAIDGLDPEGLHRHIRTLASDAFEGRAPGSPGEEKTVAYLIDEFRKLGLAPGNPDGTFVQDVPLIGFEVTRAAGTFRTGPAREPIPLKFLDNWVAVSRSLVPKVAVDDSEVVFVGYGVVAPEYGWDDYKGVDVRGKTLLMLVNDPPVPDPNDPAQLDASLFKGKAMTYYGRWTYKYEIASEKGAAAAILIHETGPAGYPFAVVTGSWGRENFELRREGTDKDTGRVKVEGWIALDTAKQLLAASGQDLDRLKEQARHRTFRPVAIDATASFSVENRLREIRSRNVLARLEGSDPARRRRTRGLHRALGPPGTRPRARGRPDLQRRRR